MLPAGCGGASVIETADRDHGGTAARIDQSKAARLRHVAGWIEDRHLILVTAACRRPRGYLIVKRGERAVAGTQIGEGVDRQIGDNLKAHIAADSSDAAGEPNCGVTRLEVVGTDLDRAGCCKGQGRGAGSGARVVDGIDGQGSRRVRLVVYSQHPGLPGGGFVHKEWQSVGFGVGGAGKKYRGEESQRSQG